LIQRLLTIINSISDYLNGATKDLGEALKTLNIMKPRAETVPRTGNEKKYSSKKSKKSDDDEQFEPRTKTVEGVRTGKDDNEPALKRKRKLRFDFAKIDDESSIDDDIKEIQRINKEKGTSNSALKNKSNKKTDTEEENIKKANERDSESFKAIDTVIDEMAKQFPDKTRNQILEAFKAVSFNIPNAYQYLSDPVVYASKKLNKF
jgi:hypothetical protein